jgi:DNA gyrase subunit A
VAIMGVLPSDELMLISRNGIVNRQRVDEIRVIGRATQGVRVMALDGGDVLMDVARVVPEDENGSGALDDLVVDAALDDLAAASGVITETLTEPEAEETPSDE